MRATNDQKSIARCLFSSKPCMRSHRLSEEPHSIPCFAQIAATSREGRSTGMASRRWLGVVDMARCVRCILDVPVISTVSNFARFAGGFNPNLIAKERKASARPLGKKRDGYASLLFLSICRAFQKEKD